MQFNVIDIIKKIFCFVLIVGCIGLPVISFFSFAIIFISGLVIVCGSIKNSLKGMIGAILVAIFIFAVKSIIPHAGIQEGHNIFFTKGANETLEKELPPEVFSFMKQQFLKRYPLDKRNYSSELSCWRISEAPKSAFVFSADSVFMHPKYSRIVDGINFDNLTEFRGGFANSSEYNWFGPNDLKRENMPYFVMYELSPASVNSSLCWTGYILWEDTESHYYPVYNKSKGCKKITHLDIGRKVFGAAIYNKEQTGFWGRFKNLKSRIKSLFSKKKVDNNQVHEDETPLSMHLILSPLLTFAAILKRAFEIFGAFFILKLMVKLDRKRFLLALLIIAASTIIAYLYCPHLFGQYYIHEGGEDGLTHETLGRAILINALSGNWIQALRGGQDIFWDTPGFRYFRALEKLFFGDTDFGYLTVVLIMPYVLYGFLANFISKKWAFWATIFFVFNVFLHSHALERLGISYHIYVMVVRGGWPDTLAYTSFLGGITLALRYIKRRDGSYLWYGFWAHFLLFITVFMRPQFCVSALIVVLYLAARLLKERRIKEMLLTWPGFVPVLFPLVHNYLFGKKIYLFTGAIDLAVNTPPSAYIAAFRELITRNFSGKSLTHVSSHIKIMIGPWYRLILLGFVFYAAFLKKIIPSDMRMIAIVCFSLHFINLFIFATSFRYVFLSWALTIIIVIFLVWLWLDGRKVGGDHVGF